MVYVSSFRSIAVIAVVLLLSIATASKADQMESYVIGGHGQANVKHPDWFKDTFFDLREDLEEARDSGKRGVIVF